jgi:hypothetical protein
VYRQLATRRPEKDIFDNQTMNIINIISYPYQGGNNMHIMDLFIKYKRSPPGCYVII